MYRVMIMDDEKAVRSLIKRLVNWEELGGGGRRGSAERH